MGLTLQPLIKHEKLYLVVVKYIDYKILKEFRGDFKSYSDDTTAKAARHFEQLNFAWG